MRGLIDGKRVNIPNVGTVEVFSISAINRALTDAGFPRSVRTLNLWEKDGLLPPPPFRIRFGGNDIRCYSYFHIKAIVDTVIEFNLIQGKIINKLAFSRAISERWKVANKNIVEGKTYVKEETGYTAKEKISRFTEKRKFS